MKQQLMTIFARTPISVGAGSSVGAIDLPVMRERHTRIPIIPGSSVKGVLRDYWNHDKAVQKQFFGSSDYAGKLFVGEARVLAFPVRSARGMFAWITSPLALERFKRDSEKDFAVPTLKDMECSASQNLCFEGTKHAVFEEYCFEQKSAISSDILNALKDLSDDSVWTSLQERLAVISDDMFSYFVENACEIPARICIDDDTGVVADGALFYQEQVPSETLFYSVLSEQENDIISKIKDKLDEVKVLQFGGDETTGLGYCSIKIM